MSQMKESAGLSITTRLHFTTPTMEMSLHAYRLGMTGNVTQAKSAQ